MKGWIEMTHDKSIVIRAREIQSELVENRRQLHRNPELGMKLPNTVSFVQRKLG